MVKRACPFSDDLNPQVKIHVSEKEVACGVLSNHHMKQVYDKTKDLLFLGAKKATTVKPPAESTIPFHCLKINGTSMHISSVNQPMKQMRLTRQGQLSCSNSTQIVSICETRCSRCSISNQAEMCSCSFCDIPLCSSCCQVCFKCHGSFCTGCSFNVYDAVEGFICRNCC